MYDRWVRGAANGKVSGIVLLDLSAAFDLVNPTLLLKKLEVYGLQPDFINWIHCYLSGRKQTVWIDHTMSPWLDVNVGVPQGSILGPLLFVIFGNDLPFIMTCSLDQYADDGTISCSDGNAAAIKKTLEENCSVTSTWMDENELCLNADKTHLMVCGTGQRTQQVRSDQRIQIEMDGQELLESDSQSEKLLGVRFQTNLKWNQHVKELQSKLKNRLAGLMKIKFLTSVSHKKVIAESIFQSVMTYCIAVWGGTTKGNIDSIQVLQNQAARIVLNQPKRVHRVQLYTILSWLTVNQLVVFHRILAVYKIRSCKEPEYLATFLTEDNIRGNIVIPNTASSLFRKSFVVHGAELWNSLPHGLRQMANLQTFKKELKKWVLENVPQFL